MGEIQLFLAKLYGFNSLRHNAQRQSHSKFIRESAGGNISTLPKMFNKQGTRRDLLIDEIAAR